MTSTAPPAVATLRSPGTIRERCGRILQAGLDGQLDHFCVRPERLDETADFVAGATRDAYPDLDVPYHGRWRHLAAGGVDRVGLVDGRLADRDDLERSRCHVDLVFVSVLLDAGAGTRWTYREEATGRVYSRSEGLAVASVDMFLAGLFSDRPGAPLRVDASRLRGLELDEVGRGLQATGDNPLVGLEGRVELLRRLGSVLDSRPDLFGERSRRPGGLVDSLRERHGPSVRAAALLEALLDGLGPIWPGRIEIDGVNLGDVWRHPAAGGDGSTAGLVPFHKLSQWLAYSLVEPLEAAGMELAGLDELTGLAEYRNGGLFVDLGVLEPAGRHVTAGTHQPGSEVVVEWRALTLALLDRLAPRVRARLGVGEREFPLARILEGGTWRAGRLAAAARRADLSPPIRVDSDGTVF